jgi:hypothetical protein
MKHPSHLHTRPYGFTWGEANLLHIVRPRQDEVGRKKIRERLCSLYAPIASGPLPNLLREPGLDIVNKGYFSDAQSMPHSDVFERRRRG